jgi:hypothetical protein
MLRELVERGPTWPSPRATHDSGGHRGRKDSTHAAVKAEAVPESAPLSSRWVSQLMGFPDGWLDVEYAPPKIRRGGRAAQASRSKTGKRRGPKAASRTTR